MVARFHERSRDGLRALLEAGAVKPEPSTSNSSESDLFLDNPKSAMPACYSALAAFRQCMSTVRYCT